MKVHNKIRIQFLGQCIALNRHGGISLSYPYLAKQMLSATFPALTFKINVVELSHPKGLKALIRARLLLFRPDVMVISLPALYVSAPLGIDLITQLAPELTVTARSFLQKIDAKLTKTHALEGLVNKKLTWRPTVVHPRLTINEFERLIEEAIEFCSRMSDCKVILFGPGGFNEDLKTDTAMSPQIFASVNEMILRLSQRMRVPVINANDLMGMYDGSVFLANSNLYSQYGHELVAREVYSVIAAQVTALNRRSEELA